MKKLELTQGQYALVDDEDYDYLMQWKWFAHWSNITKSYYAQRNEGKIPNRSVVHMSREVMKTPKDMRCDHKNHDTLNNQKYNLRNVTRSQNGMNSRVYKNNELGERNIIKTLWNTYRVQIYKDKKRVFCKAYKSLDEAIAARDSIISKIHGEFVYTGESR